MRIRWRNLELPSRVALDPTTATPTYGAFVAEPFERGFGHTIANSLRRILLSSLEGSAVTRAKIAGVQHEFSTIPGVVEDVTDICLNLKSLVVKNHSSGAKTIRIDRRQRGVVTGADVITDDQVEVVNKDLIIATMTDDVPLSIELTVENGRGFVPASEQFDQMLELGVIPLDAAYSPITRVRYKVEDTRVGQRTNYDKLTLEIWTNGTVTPEMALVEAAKILRKHLNPFVQLNELGPAVFSQPRTVGPVGLDPAVEAKLSMTLAELNLSVRAMNCLESENIRTVRDLVVRTPDQLLAVRNFGETTLNEVVEKLADIGLRLGMRLPSVSVGRG